MKRFILGTLTGVLAVAIIVTFIPDRAHNLIDQAGDVRGLLEDVASRLERLEQEPSQIESVEVLLPAPSRASQLPELGSYQANQVVVPATSSTIAAVSVSEPAQSEQPLPSAIQRQAIDFDNLATGLSRVSGALERLNRTMKPGNRPSRSSSGSAASDGSSS